MTMTTTTVPITPCPSWCQHDPGIADDECHVWEVARIEGPAKWLGHSVYLVGAANPEAPHEPYLTLTLRGDGAIPTRGSLRFPLTVDELESVAAMLIEAAAALRETDVTA